MFWGNVFNTCTCNWFFPPTYRQIIFEKFLKNNYTLIKNCIYITLFFFQILSFICLICTWAGANLNCDYAYGSSYGFFEFVAGSVFLTDVINYLIFALTIDEKWCMKFVPWLVWVRKKKLYFHKSFVTYKVQILIKLGIIVIFIN